MSVNGVMYRNKTTKGSDLTSVRSIERTLEWSRFLESSFPSFIKKMADSFVILAGTYYSAYTVPWAPSVSSNLGTIV